MIALDNAAGFIHTLASAQQIALTAYTLRRGPVLEGEAWRSLALGYYNAEQDSGDSGSELDEGDGETDNRKVTLPQLIGV